MTTKTVSAITAWMMTWAVVPAAPAEVCWRWTSNATAENPVWTDVTEREVRIPAFTGATAADNVLELVGECVLAETVPTGCVMTLRAQSNRGSLAFDVSATSAMGLSAPAGGLVDDRAETVVRQTVATESAEAEPELLLDGFSDAAVVPDEAFGRHLGGDSATAAQFINDLDARFHGRVENGWLVWTDAESPARLPTVDGQVVNPGEVFTLARSVKPIVYPSTPELSGEEGSQQIGFGGFSVVVPRHYTASLQGCVIAIELNRNAAPTIADSDDGEKKGIALKDGQVKIHFEPQAEGLFYTLETALEPQGEWMSAVGPQAGTDFSVQVDGEKRFYRIKVSD